jgi:anaerobic magnesium-protoporphyrin IX monomethyl ester cyclase
MLPRNILFIYPPVTSETTRGLEANLLNGSAISPEISFLYLGAFLHAKIPGIEIEYIDFRIEAVDRSEAILLDVLNSGRFGFVGITCYSPHYLSTIAIASLIKKINKNIVTIVGGFHPTIYPQDFNHPGSPIDYVIRGEGEITLYQLIARGSEFVPSTRVVDGISIDNLDDIPPITLDLIEKYKKRMDLSDLPVYFSRGCTFDCTFCIARENTCGLKHYRVLSPDKAKVQIDLIAEHNPKRITITDSLFGVNQKWFDAITTFLQQKNRPYKVKVEAHVDSLNARKLQALIRSGIDLTVGFENASPQQLILMNKTANPARYVQRMNQIINIFSGSGRELIINVLLGHPGETKHTIDETFSFLDAASTKLDATLIKYSLFRLYPGTPVFQDAKFFEDVLGSVFYLKDWWYHEVDHSIYPSIVDPSRHLDLISEITYIRDKINSLYGDLISRNEGSSVVYKLAFLRYLSRVNRSYDGLKDRMASLRENIPKIHA